MNQLIKLLSPLVTKKIENKLRVGAKIMWESYVLFKTSEPSEGKEPSPFRVRLIKYSKTCESFLIAFVSDRELKKISFH